MAYEMIQEGHEYQILNYDAGFQIEEKELSANDFQTLRFIQILPDGTRIDGVSNEAVLEVLIDRTKYLNSKFPCPENEIAISSMETALGAFNQRTKDRQSRRVEGKHEA